MIRSEYDWVIHCQGCHGKEAQGSPGGAPPLMGQVARFLRVPEGRAYLVRVPGVAFADLPDAELADLLNWVLERFDSADVPKDFAAYSAEEVGLLRRQPLISGAPAERQKLLLRLAKVL
jgi:hypothetical protein